MPHQAQPKGPLGFRRPSFTFETSLRSEQPNEALSGLYHPGVQPPDSTRWCLRGVVEEGTTTFASYSSRKSESLCERLRDDFLAASQDVKYPDFGIYNVIFVDLCNIKNANMYITILTLRMRRW